MCKTEPFTTLIKIFRAIIFGGVIGWSGVDVVYFCKTYLCEARAVLGFDNFMGWSFAPFFCGTITLGIIAWSLWAQWPWSLFPSLHGHCGLEHFVTFFVDTVAFSL